MRTRAPLHRIDQEQQLKKMQNGKAGTTTDEQQ